MRIGIDIGGTSMTAALVDGASVSFKQRSATAGLRTEDALINTVFETVDRLFAESGISKSEISSMGIGVPGRTDIATGTAILAGNLPVRNTCFKKLLEDRYGIVTYLDNDANCAAWGEYSVGIGKGLDDMVMVTLGTGIGGGIIIDGKILHGQKNRAGELGHQVVDIHGKRCPCGRVGCWETVASTKAMASRVAQEVMAVPYGILADVVNENGGKIDGRTLFIALKRGDRVAMDLFDEYIEMLSVGILNILEAFRPQMLVIGGGVSKEGDVLLLPLRKLIGETPCRIETSALADEAGLIGAALLDLSQK